MSEYKPNENNNLTEEDKRVLFDLLDRLEQRDEVQRRQTIRPAASVPADLIEVEDEDDDQLLLQIDSFEPNRLSDNDIRDLLITPDYDYEDEDSLVSLGAFASDQEDEDLPAPPVRRNPFAVLWAGFAENLPHREDSTGTKVRKCGFLTSLLVMVVALIYLAVDLLLIPAQNTKLKNELIEIYHPEQSLVVVEEDEGDYPEKMLASFKDLYDRNDDVRGWISYHASGKTDFLDIEYPIVYSGDNEKYLKKDFDGNKNRNGTLFFDQANKLNSYMDQNRSLIVYGHNMASGQMFAGLNKFLGSVNNARTAAVLTMSTLYRQDRYKVFAVILTDESDTAKGRYFNTRRTTFTSDADFLQYVADMRARSLFDYPVDVQSDDQLLVLSTCTGKTSAHVKDGRLVVVARRLRDGEESAVNTAAIVKNSDVIMPYYWYLNQKKTPHKYYIESGLDYPEVPEQPNNSTMHTGRTETTTTTEGAIDGTTTSGSVTGSGTTATTVQRPSGSTATGTKPTAGTTATTKPTEGTTPTAGTTVPTEPTNTTAGSDPTDSTTPSTEPTESTEPSTEPTEPTGEPTEPTEPSAEPTESTTTTETTTTTEPSAEPTEPTEPTTAE